MIIFTEHIHVNAETGGAAKSLNIFKNEFGDEIGGIYSFSLGKIKLNAGDRIGKQIGLFGLIKLLNTIRLRRDNIYINTLWSFANGIIISIFCRLFSDKIIIGVRGMLDPGALSQKKVKKRVALLILKRIWSSDKIYFHTTSSQETDQVKKYFTNEIIEARDLLEPDRDRSFFEQRNLSSRLLFLSRIDRKKNLLYAVKIVAKIEGLEMDIYGPIADYEYWKEIKNYIDSLNCGHRIKYCGELTPEESKSKYASYGLYILPTLGENFGYTIVESLACGTPVLLSNNVIWNVYDTESIKCIELANTSAWESYILDFLNKSKSERITLRTSARRAFEKIRDSQDLEAYRKLFS